MINLNALQRVLPISGLWNEEGQMLACIPNIQHWTILINLLRGQWQYEDEGLLDRTHVRFFTLSSMQELFANAGLHVFDIKQRNFEETQGFKKAQTILAPAAAALGLDAKRLALQTRALQYVLRATKKPVENKLLIQAMLGETKVCSQTQRYQIRNCSPIGENTQRQMIPN